MDNKPNMPPASNNTADAFNKPQGDSRQQATSSSAEIRKDVDRATGKVADTAEFALIRLTIVAPGRYRTGCNNCSENDTRSVVLDRVGLEYKSGYVQRYFIPARDGLVEVTGKR